MQIVYLAARHDKPQPATLFLGSLDGSAERFIAEADTNAIAVPGALVFLSGGKLLVQGFNHSTAALDAGAARIKGSIRMEPNNLNEEIKSLAKDKDIYVYCT